MNTYDLRPRPLYCENLSDLNKNGTSDYIRLLRVIAVEKTHIVCELRVFRLKTAPPFAALSYCWGKGDRDKIACFAKARPGIHGRNCRHLCITTHLYEGLRRLDDLNEYGWLWNDATCINQVSAEEKNDQVSRMRSIYSNARMVYIWLGTIKPAASLRRPRIKYLSGAECFPRKNIIALLSLGSDVWWKRLWVIQELCSGQTVSVLLSNEYMSWEHLVKTMRDGYYTEPLENRSEVDSDFDDQFTIIDRLQFATNLSKEMESAMELKPRTTETQQLCSCLEDWRLRELAWTIMALHFLRNQSNHNRLRDLDLFELLHITGSQPSEVSNPLDRVYSVLGLAHASARTDIPIRYDVDPLEMFAKLCMHIIGIKSLNLCYLHWPRGTGMIGSRRCLPTWMPNFLTPVQSAIDYILLADFEASRDVKSDSVVVENEDTYHLHTKVLTCGTVTKHGSHCSQPDEERYIEDSLGQVDTVVPPSSPQSILSGPNDVEDALAAMDKAINVTDRTEFTPQVATIFRLDSGLTGVSTGDVQYGDEAIIPFGFYSPWIVRSCCAELRVTNHPTVFSLIGECYVQGVMHGELFDLWEEGKMPSSTYVLR